MKKKLSYLFTALLLTGVCIFLSSCERPLAPGQGCLCKYDGEYPTKYDYDWMQKKNFKYCSELEKLLQESENEHKVTCVPSW